MATFGRIGGHEHAPEIEVARRVRDGTSDGLQDPGETAPRGSAPFRPPCVSLDLEVGRDECIHALEAVRADTGRSLTHSGSGLAAALATVLAFVAGCVTVDGSTRTAEGMMPKDDTKAGIEQWKCGDYFDSYGFFAGLRNVDSESAQTTGEVKFGKFVERGEQEHLVGVMALMRVAPDSNWTAFKWMLARSCK